MDSTGFSLVYYLKHLDTNYSFLYLLSLIMCERAEKIIARTLCFMHQRIFRPIYIFNNYAYFLDFRAQKFPLIFLNLNPKNINKPCILGFQLRARVGRPQTSSSPPVIFIAGRPKAALLFWFFCDFRCGALLFMVIHVIYKYKNK